MDRWVFAVAVALVFLVAGLASFVVSADGDGLTDGEEVHTHRTDPTAADSDGDRFDDGEEVAGVTVGCVPLPGADPVAMDLYVQFDTVADVDARAPSFVNTVAGHWADMPVENPDGSTGIDLHVRQGTTLDGPGTYDGTNFAALRDAYHEPGLGDRVGGYHQAIFLPFEAGVGGDGVAESPGRFTIIDTIVASDVQAAVVVHELLHNVMGELEASQACDDDPHHYCDDGWLQAVVTLGEDEFLPRPLADEIERNGFE